jgi:NDP-sugar pyrophosphorylase family protein
MAFNVREFYFNLHHLAETLSRIIDEVTVDLDVKVVKSIEFGPTGPLGGLAIFAHHFDANEVVLVFSGDALTDLNIGEFYEFHRGRGAEISVMVKVTGNAGKYGVVEICHGRVISMTEKPKLLPSEWRHVSCGVYLVNGALVHRIPQNTFLDFGTFLIPKLIERGESVGAFVWSRYWRDIGDQHSLLQANFDALGGDVVLASVVDSIRANADRVVDKLPQGALSRRIFIGVGARVAADVVLEDFSIIGSHASIGSKAHLSRVLVLPNSEILDGSIIVDAVAFSGSTAHRMDGR